VTGMARDQILAQKDRKVPYEQGLEKYRELRKLQEQAADAAESLRRHQICTVRRGVPSFYAGYRQVLADAKAIRRDAARCGKPRQWIKTSALSRIYNWHHAGVLRDRRGPDPDTGWVSRHGWLEEGYTGYGIPPALTSVLCN